MASQIKLSPDQMRGRANEYRNQAEAVDEVISAMDRLLTNLQSEWEGDASAAYGEKYESLRPGFVSAVELINDIAQALDSTAQSLEETDAAIAGQFRQ